MYGHTPDYIKLNLGKLQYYKKSYLCLYICLSYSRCLVSRNTFSKRVVLLCLQHFSREWKSNTNIILLQSTDYVHFALFIIVFSKPVFIKIYTFFGYKTEHCSDYFLRRRFIVAFKFMKDTRCCGPPISRTFFL